MKLKAVIKKHIMPLFIVLMHFLGKDWAILGRTSESINIAHIFQMFDKSPYNQYVSVGFYLRYASYGL